jgi:autotransporter-associated beta strand protein
VAADGGGGAALGGAVFVRAGGTLILNETSFHGGHSVTGGSTGGAGGATAGQAHGSVIFLDANVRTVFDVKTGMEAIKGGDAIAGDGGFTKTGAGTLVLAGTDSYAGGTTLQQGTLDVTAPGAAGTGTITFTGKATLEIANSALPGHVFGNSIDDFGKHDALDLSGLHFHNHAKATYHAVTDELTVRSGIITDTLTLLAPSGTHFAVASDGHGGTEVTLDPPLGHATAHLHDVSEQHWAAGSVGSTHPMGDYLVVV